MTITRYWTLLIYQSPAIFGFGFRQLFGQLQILAILILRTSGIVRFWPLPDFGQQAFLVQ